MHSVHADETHKNGVGKPRGKPRGRPRRAEQADVKFCPCCGTNLVAVQVALAL